MLIIVVGPGGVGKNKLVDTLLLNNPLYWLPTDTTRPIRPGETPDITYHYLSEQEFETRKLQGEYLETATYYTTNAHKENLVWKYGSPKGQFMAASISPDIYISILTPAGERALRDANIEHTTFLLTAEKETLRSRMIDMDHRDINEANRRLAADEKVFANLSIHGAYTFYTDKATPIELADAIWDRISLEFRLLHEKEIKDNEIDL